MTKISIHPLNQSTPLLWSIAWLPSEIVSKYKPRSWTKTSSKQRLLCRELVKVRNLQSLLVCSTILWRISSTEDDWIFGWRSKLASQILVSFWSSTFLRCRHVNWFFNSFPPSRIQRCAKTFPDIPDVSKIFGGSSVCRCDMKASFNNPSNGGCLRIDPGWLVTCGFPLQIDSTSRKSLESFMQFTPFYSSWSLPDNSTTVFWSSMNFCLVKKSKVEF